MSRSRAGILAGASECILKFGTHKTTMGDIARVGGVAKATLYNHFRDKRELYAALVVDEVDGIIARCAAAYAVSAGDPLVDGLAAAAAGVANHPVLRCIAETEPAVLGALVRASDAPPWQRARRYAAGLLGAAAPSAAGDLALRWVASQAPWPATTGEIRSAAVAVAAAMRAVAAGDPGDPGDPGDAGRAGAPGEEADDGRSTEVSRQA